jgi:hypothetical protein
VNNICLCEDCDYVNCRCKYCRAMESGVCEGGLCGEQDEDED